jgi:hypothetical protein
VAAVHLAEGEDFPAGGGVLTLFDVPDSERVSILRPGELS